MNVETTRRSIHIWLKPGVALMQSMHMPVKLGVLAGLLVTPLIAIAWFQISALCNDYAIARANTDGVAVIQTYFNVIDDLEALRARALSAKSAQQEGGADSASAAQLSKDIAALEAALGSHPEFALSQSWGAIKPRVEELAAPAASDDALALAAKYSDLMAGLRGQVSRIAEESQLALDRIAKTYYLQDILTAHLIDWHAAAGSLQA